MLAADLRDAVTVLKENNVTSDPKQLQEISDKLTGKVQEAA